MPKARTSAATKAHPVRRGLEQALLERDRLELGVMDALLSRVEDRQAGGRSRACRGFRSILCPVDFSEHSRLALKTEGDDVIVHPSERISHGTRITVR
jgi:hypothetical protein